MLLNKKLLLTPASSPVSSPSSVSSKGKYKLGSKGGQQKLSSYKTEHQVPGVLTASNYYGVSDESNDERKLCAAVGHKFPKTSGDYFTHKPYSESDSSDFNESDADSDFDNSFTEYSLSFPKLNHKHSISKKTNHFKANSRPTTPVIASAAPNDKKSQTKKRNQRSGAQQFHAKALDNISTKLNDFTYFIPSKVNEMMNSSSSAGSNVSNSKPQMTKTNSFSSSESFIKDMGMKNDKELRYNFYIQCDLDARERCFNYILETIDAVWARYCDATTLVEEEFYPTTGVHNLQNNNMKAHKRSVSNMSRESSTDENADSNPIDVLDQKSRRRCSSIVSGKSISMMSHNPMTSLSAQIDTQNNNSATELEVDVNKLNHFKQRLSSTKIYMEDLVDSTDMLDLVNFWKKWDLIKYNCIQFMENDEDEYEDDIYGIDNYANYNDQETQHSSMANTKSFMTPDSFDMCDEVLNKLEKGRYYYNNDDL